MKRLEGYRNFCNKIWNAARYVLMNGEEHSCGQNGEAYRLSLADRWIISRLQQAETDVIAAIDNYRFDLALRPYMTLCGMNIAIGIWSCLNLFCGTIMPTLNCNWVLAAP